MKLEELKKGDVFYSVSLAGIERYEYLMLYPFHNQENVKVKGYHIVLKKSLDEPIRIYYTHLEKILSLECFTYEEAKIKELELFEKHVEYLRSKLENKN